MCFTKDNSIGDVISCPAFQDFGRLLFPIDRHFDIHTKLEDIDDIYIWYHYINVNKTIEILNYFKQQSNIGNQIFYDIYTDREKKKDESKKNTGLFFFRGNTNAPFAIVNAGGGFMYVAAMHDSFPQALEISKRGYHAFALIYRPDHAMEDLAKAISFVFEHQSELKVNTSFYSLWGGSAGARMAAILGNYGTQYFGQKEYPRPATIVMQYTGFSQVTGNEPPTYCCVGTHDHISSYQIMKNRVDRLKKNGTDASIDIFKGLPHGFGLGEGTCGKGWIDHAVDFWEKHVDL
ncbi:MAG: alpha/beta hydrolase [Faecalibacillus sp.]